MNGVHFSPPVTSSLGQQASGETEQRKSNTIRPVKWLHYLSSYSSKWKAQTSDCQFLLNTHSRSYFTQSSLFYPFYYSALLYYWLMKHPHECIWWYAELKAASNVRYVCNSVMKCWNFDSNKVMEKLALTIITGFSTPDKIIWDKMNNY